MSTGAAATLDARRQTDALIGQRSPIVKPRFVKSDIISACLTLDERAAGQTCDLHAYKKRGASVDRHGADSGSGGSLVRVRSPSCLAMDGENDTLGNETFLEVQEEIEEEIVSEGWSQNVFVRLRASSTLHFFCQQEACNMPTFPAFDREARNLSRQTFALPWESTPSTAARHRALVIRVQRRS